MARGWNRRAGSTPAAYWFIDSKNSPFDGRRLQGKVIGTWVGGRKVF